MISNFCRPDFMNQAEYVEDKAKLSSIAELRNIAKKEVIAKRAEEHLKNILNGGAMTANKVSKHMLHYDSVLKIVAEISEEKAQTKVKMIAKRKRAKEREQKLLEEQLNNPETLEPLVIPDVNATGDVEEENFNENSNLSNVPVYPMRPNKLLNNTPTPGSIVNHPSLSFPTTPPPHGSPPHQMKTEVKPTRTQSMGSKMKLMKQMQEEAEKQALKQKMYNKENKSVEMQKLAGKEAGQKLFLVQMFIASRAG